MRDLVARAFDGAADRERAARRRAAARGAAASSIRNKELEQSHVCLGTSGYQQDHEDRYSSYVLNTMLGGSMSSRLFQNVREKRGLAYAVFSGLSAYRDAGSMTIYAGCANDAVGELIDVVIAELRRMKDEPLPESELRRAKDHLKGSLMLNLESTSSRMSHLARQEIYFDRQFGLDETLEGVERVTLRRRAARGARSVRGRRAGRDGARRRQRPAAAAGEAGTRMNAASMIRTLHAARDGSHLERPAEVRDLAAGRDRRGRRDGRAPASSPPTPRATSASAARFDIARIEEIEQITQHDVIAFTTAVAEHVGPSARWLHFGLTSSDVIDTAQALQMREACDLILQGSRRR